MGTEPSPRRTPASRTFHLASLDGPADGRSRRPTGQATRFDRYDANQLFRVDCAPQDFEGMLVELARRSSDKGLGFRKMSGYDPEVWRQLGPYLEARGWGVWTSALMLLSDEPAREPNPDLLIRSVGPDSPDLEELYRTDGVLDRGFELARSQFERQGGAYLVGYLDGRPAGA